mmetsp:Transcript_32028/g.68264  ORF Transcript_32028/g.68264 Transcript_32028/m.68264 type:complete len:231 (-) Transcript_32028:590-1282(-)
MTGHAADARGLPLLGRDLAIVVGIHGIKGVLLPLLLGQDAIVVVIDLVEDGHALAGGRSSSGSAADTNGTHGTGNHGTGAHGANTNGRSASRNHARSQRHRLLGSTQVSLPSHHHGAGANGAGAHWRGGVSHGSRHRHLTRGWDDQRSGADGGSGRGGSAEVDAASLREVGGRLDRSGREGGRGRASRDARGRGRTQERVLAAALRGVHHGDLLLGLHDLRRLLLGLHVR